MTIQLIILPLLVQLISAVVLLFFWRKPEWQRYLSIAGSVIGLIAAIGLFSFIWQHGIMIMQAGSWAAPFGITLVVDTFSATLVLITSIVAVAIAIFSAGSIINSRVQFGYFPILHFLIMGLIGAFITGDIFNLYVWFEIIIISSFVLLTIGGKKSQLEGAVKYFTLNMLASIIFLTAIAILYGITGTLNMADLAVKIQQVENQNLIKICSLIFFIGFGIKSAVFPLYFWLPASYHTPPPAVSAIFGGLLTKVGVYAMIRVFTLIFIRDEFTNQVLLWVAALTIISGGLGALTQTNIVKVFSYLIICHIGFMILGLGLGNELGLRGTVYYMFHDIIVKANLFLVAGLIYKISATNRMANLGGLYDQYPRLSLLMAIPLFSLVGIPPLSGFWPKISLINGALEKESYMSIFFLLFGTFITLFVIASLWTQAFWKKKAKHDEPQYFVNFNSLNFKVKALWLSPIIILSVVTLYIGFGASKMQNLAMRIADELGNKVIYIEAVLNP